MATKSGSPPCSAIFALIHARARLTSRICAGQGWRGTEPVAHRHTYPACRRQPGEQWVRLASPAAGDPAAPGHLENHWRARVVGKIPVAPDVELVEPLGIPVGKGRLRTHVTPSPPHQWSTGGQPDCARCPDDVGSLADRVADRLVQHRFRSQLALVDARQTEPGQTGETERGAPRASLDVSASSGAGQSQSRQSQRVQG